MEICDEVEFGDVRIYNGVVYCLLESCPHGNKGARLYVKQLGGRYNICNIIQSEEKSLVEVVERGSSSK